MVDEVPLGAWSSPSIARNREPILEALRPMLPKRGVVLEIAAGSGEHAVYMAQAIPDLEWLPTDPSPQALVSIAAWRDRAGLANLLAPLSLDASAPDSWPVDRADAVVSINMIHIAPWGAAEGLMRGAARLLKPGGLLFLYGPYLEMDVETAPSNRAFDTDLKRRNPQWGLRRLEDVTDLASLNSFERCLRLSMPANNLALAFRRVRRLSTD